MNATRSIAALVTAVSLAMTMSAAPADAHGDDDLGGPSVWRDLLAAARTSAHYHNITNAKTDGYVPFAIPEEVGGTLLDLHGAEITCFDSDDGGMGVHYVRNIDAILDPADPEAVVYQVGHDNRLRLVALEYLIPVEYVDPSNPPVLFGQSMHRHPYLPVYILHVWLWKWNPNGLFANFNPRVPACPDPTTPSS
jgi:hypothetical protein